MRFENSCGRCDDTAGNGLQLIYCKFNDWGVQENKVFHGIWGSWEGVKMCPQGFFVVGCRVRF